MLESQLSNILVYTYSFVYTHSFSLKEQHSLCVYKTTIRIGNLKHFTNPVKIVKNECIYEVPNLKLQLY